MFKFDQELRKEFRSIPDSYPYTDNLIEGIEILDRNFN